MPQVLDHKRPIMTPWGGSYRGPLVTGADGQLKRASTPLGTLAKAPWSALPQGWNLISATKGGWKPRGFIPGSDVTADGNRIEHNRWSVYPLANMKDGKV